ncbi:MAG TPA: CAP domain-containing protein [Phycisphaerae bacterium]|nr:CAP domain-containing protein [Phycisphaerae bacterium]
MRRPVSMLVLPLWLCALVPTLAGCPGSGEGPPASPIASMIVEGIQPASSTCHTPANEQTLRERVFDLINQERTSRGLLAVTFSTQLDQMAEDYACEMIEGHFFGHTNPYTGEEPGQRALDAGYIYLAVGENLAGGQTSPEQVMAEWMASTLHRQNILAAQWREMGLGVRTGGQHGVYWVLEFGNPP